MIAIITITANGARIGSTLGKAIPDATLFVLEKHACAGATPFTEGVPALVRRLWPGCCGLVFVTAAGIAVRAIAPLLQSKDRDPAVVVLDDAGRFAVSLLSGHLGGANALAERCAALTGSLPVITTATDANGLPSFDLLAKAEGWAIEDLSRVKVLNALLLEGKEIAVVEHGDRVREYCGGRGKLRFCETLEEARESGAGGVVWVTARQVPPGSCTDTLLVLRPVRLCLGIGCNSGTTREEITAVVGEALATLSVSMKSVACVATASAKKDEPGLVAFAAAAGLPLLCFEPEQLNGVEAPSPPSRHALKAIGARGVAEPAALLASGGGRLLLHKVKSGNVTLAIAERD